MATNDQTITTPLPNGQVNLGTLAEPNIMTYPVPGTDAQSTPTTITAAPVAPPPSSNTSTVAAPKLGQGPINAATPQPSPNIAGSLGFFKSYANGQGTDGTLQDDTAQIEEEQAKGKTLIEKAFSALANIGTRKQEVYTENNVDDLRAITKSATRALRVEQDAVQSKIEKINSRKGVLASANEADIAEAQRQSAIKQGRLTLNLSLANGDYTSAKEAADRTIEAETDNLKYQLDGYKYFYQENKDKLDKREQRQWDQFIKQKDREYQEDYDKKKTISNLVIDAAQGGAPMSVIQKAQTAETVEEAAGLLAPYSLDAQAKRATISNVYSQIAERNAKSSPENFVTPPAINPQTGKPDPASQVSSAVAGSKLKTTANLQNVISVLTGAQSIADANPDGVFPGIKIGSPRGSFTALLGPKGQANQSSIDALNLKIQQWASGASLTSEQTKKVDNMTPKVGDTNSQIKNKLNALTNYMLTQVQSEFVSQGYGFQPTPIDYFSTSSKLTEKDISDMDAALNK